MALSKYEIEKITTQIRIKLLEKGFEFESLELSQVNTNIKLEFIGSKHIHYKNVRMMSYESHYKETPLYTQVYLNLRFLFGRLQSPKIGMKITSFKMNIS